jgi:hypothetical protein
MGIDHQQTSQDGIIPRFIYSLFDNLQTKSQQGYNCQVCVSFLELHNEDLIDLLNPIPGFNLTIREDSRGNINWHGVHEEAVYSPMQLIEYVFLRLLPPFFIKTREPLIAFCLLLLSLFVYLQIYLFIF